MEETSIRKEERITDEQDGKKYGSFKAWKESMLYFATINDNLQFGMSALANIAAKAITGLLRGKLNSGKGTKNIRLSRGALHVWTARSVALQEHWPN